MATLSLDAQLARLESQLDDFVADAHRATSIELTRRVVLKSPVHMIGGGRLRGEWQLTIGTAASTPTGKSTTGSASVLAAARAAVSRLPAYSTTFLANLMPYAPVVEYGGYPKSVKLGTWIPPRFRGKLGDDAKVTRTAVVGKRKKKTVATHVQFSEGGFSRQAPKGMARVSIQEIETAFGQIVEESVQKAQRRR